MQSSALYRKISAARNIIVRLTGQMSKVRELGMFDREGGRSGRLLLQLSLVMMTNDCCGNAAMLYVNSVFGSLKPKPAEFSAALTEYTPRNFKAIIGAAV